MSELQDILDQIQKEFRERMDELVQHNGTDIDKEIVSKLLEKLFLKYEHQQPPRKSLLGKIFPFLNNSEEDNFIANIDREVDNLIVSAGTTNGQSDKVDTSKFNKTLTSSFTEISNTQQMMTPYVPNQILSKFDEDLEDLTKYSKTNIPENMEIALEMQPLPGKGQDHIDFFVLDSGISGIIVCDGVSGDGPPSARLAQFIPQAIISYLEDHFHPEVTLSEWKNLIIDGLETAIAKYTRDKGATTILLQLVDTAADMIYIAYLGDGNLIHFNQTMTGFSKLLNPHQDQRGALNRVVTAEGIIGNPSVQILSGSGGALVISSDGYNLSNGRILRHFYQTVLKEDNLQDALHHWATSCCEDRKLHPLPSDDQSIGVMRW